MTSAGVSRLVQLDAAELATIAGPTAEVPTPCAVADVGALSHNVARMRGARPGSALRSHVKAHKSSAIAALVAEQHGSDAFCAATLREVEGMLSAGVGRDLMLANETLDTPRLARVAASAADRSVRFGIAVDSTETLGCAVEAVRRSGAPLGVWIDVNVGLPRCGCDVVQAGPLAEQALSAGLRVDGVMGYEGHVVGNEDRQARIDGVATSMAALADAHRAVGGRTAAGGTGTYDLHDWVDEVQAGSFVLMDTAYQRLDLPFEQALFVVATVISVNAGLGVATCDAGLKAFGMDHGPPSVRGYDVFFCSDEHTTFVPTKDGPGLPPVGSVVLMEPAHVDPTMALHERLLLVENGAVTGCAAVDLRGW